MAVDKHNIDRAREQITNKLLAEIVKQLVDHVIEKHKTDQDCVRISYEGTALPVAGSTSVDFDIKGQGFHFHTEHLDTTQLLNGWTTTIKEKNVYDTSHEGCGSADDLPQIFTEDLIVEYAKGTYLFNSNDKDDALAAIDCKITFRVKIIVAVRRTKCYTVTGLISEKPQSQGKRSK